MNLFLYNKYSNETRKKTMFISINKTLKKIILQIAEKKGRPISNIYVELLYFAINNLIEEIEDERLIIENRVKLMIIINKLSELEYNEKTTIIVSSLLFNILDRISKELILTRNDIINYCFILSIHELYPEYDVDNRLNIIL